MNLPDLNLGGPALQPSAEWRLRNAKFKPRAQSRQASLWQRILGWGFYGTGVAYFFAVGLERLGETSDFLSFVRAFILIAISQAILIFMYRRLSNHVHLPNPRSRLEKLSPEEKSIPVEITIRQLGTKTGVDKGWFWVEDGTLYYRGLQTAFRLNRQDIPPLGMWPKKLRPNYAEGNPAQLIPIPVDGSELFLLFRPIDVFEEYDVRRRIHNFHIKMENWLRSAPSGSMETLLPPTDIHPALKEEKAWRAEGVVAGCTLTFVSFLILFGCHTFPGVAGQPLTLKILGTLACAVLIASSLYLAWNEFRDSSQRKAIHLRRQLRGV